MSINLTLLGQAISLFIFVWFCMKYVWPPIINALQEREKRIADGLAAAEAGQDKLVEADRRLADLVDEGKQKANEIIVQAQKRGDEILEEAKGAARLEGERLIEAAPGRDRTGTHPGAGPVAAGSGRAGPGRRRTHPHARGGQGRARRTPGQVGRRVVSPARCLRIQPSPDPMPPRSSNWRRKPAGWRNGRPCSGCWPCSLPTRTCAG